uniref:four-carbon acid sugar kinase family protein n=1 Tax=Salmonella enterica TaxID=28901 RepID=UPI00398C4D6B
MLETVALPGEGGVKQSRASLGWLTKQGCQQVYLKCCATFDSTAEGYIGPVTDEQMVALDTSFTVISP